jgi:leucyl aminopeptidase
MQIRVVADQPWDVQADVLVVPIVGEPMWDGPLGEVDRRTGGELTALHAFGEIRRKRFATSLVASGELTAGRIVTVSAGDAEILDREAVVRTAAAAERRLSGRDVNRLAIWISPLVEALGEGAPQVAELVARGVIEGSYEPQAIYRDSVETAPPVLDELVIVAPGEDVAALERSAERGRIIGEGANFARTLSNRASNDVSPEVLA